MPLPTNSIVTTANGLIAEAKAVKQFCTEAINAMAAGPVSANAVIGLCQRLNSSKVNILAPAIASTPVMTELARAIGLSDAAAASAAVQAVFDAIGSAITWVVGNFPSSNVGGTVYILKDTLNADGSVSVRAFSTVQTAGFRTALQAVVDAIN